MIASYYLARWSLIAIIRLLNTICQYSHEKVFRLPDEQSALLCNRLIAPVVDWAYSERALIFVSWSCIPEPLACCPTLVVVMLTVPGKRDSAAISSLIRHFWTTSP